MTNVGVGIRNCYLRGVRATMMRISQCRQVESSSIYRYEWTVLREGAFRKYDMGEFVLSKSTIWANSYFSKVRPYFWKVHVESRMHDGWHAQMTIFGEF